MMKLTRRAALIAALSAPALLGAAPSASAQDDGAQDRLIANGHGAFTGLNQNTRLFQFSAVQKPDGSVDGHVFTYEPGTGGMVFLEVTSTLDLGGTLLLAGPITLAVNAPPQFVVGATGFFAVQDNERSRWGPSSDAITGINVVPPPFAGLTLQQIVDLIGPPPPQAFSTLLFGDIRVH